MTTLEFLNSISYHAIATGSRVTCDPPVMDTDEDYAVWSQPDTIDILLEKGYIESSGSEEYDLSEFRCYRKDDINVMVTRNVDFFHKFHQATKLAKALNLLAKSDRIMLFQAILYGKYP